MRFDSSLGLNKSKDWAACVGIGIEDRDSREEESSCGESRFHQLGNTAEIVNTTYNLLYDIEN